MVEPIVLTVATIPTMAPEPPIARLEYENQMGLSGLDREKSNVVA